MLWDDIDIQSNYIYENFIISSAFCKQHPRPIVGHYPDPSGDKSRFLICYNTQAWVIKCRYGLVWRVTHTGYGFCGYPVVPY